MFLEPDVFVLKELEMIAQRVLAMSQGIDQEITGALVHGVGKYCGGAATGDFSNGS